MPAYKSLANRRSKVEKDVLKEVLKNLRSINCNDPETINLIDESIKLIMNELKKA